MITTYDQAKINYNAIGTWLEPYIGHVFDVHKKFSKSATILMDYGKSNLCKRRVDAELLTYLEQKR